MIWRSKVGEGDLIAEATDTVMVVDLAIAASRIVLVDHSADVEFAGIPMVGVTVPAGIRVTMLLCDASGNATDGEQFALFFENISYDTDLGQGTADPDFEFTWVRRGPVTSET